MSWDDHETIGAFGVQVGMINKRLGRVALDMNIALSDIDGATRPRLVRATGALDQTLREIGLPAAGQLRLGEGGAGRRQG